MRISIGGAIISAFVIKALTDFSRRWAAFTQNIQETAEGTRHISEGIDTIMGIAKQSVTISNTLDETSLTLLNGAEHFQKKPRGFLSKLQSNAR